MIITTTENIPNKTIKETLGIVRGNTIQSRHVGRDIMAGLKTIVGGEIKSYTDMISKARDEALTRMVAEAEKLGADAILMVRFSTSSVMPQAAEVLAYGTAVKLE
ncbi:YbjQ family protein [Candidatus Woesearchaeota archaeon]|nr:YbjQ family protein [Candidatus Woesearchaeota archaeon]